MTTVANRKFSEMVQLEFQNSGSSGVTAMLLQPLLEKSSTFVCELTDMQCTIGGELAFPENEWLFSIVRKPIIPQQLDADERVRTYIHLPKLQKYIDEHNAGTEKTWDSYGIFGMFEPPDPFIGQDAVDHWVPQGMWWDDVSQPFNDATFLRYVDTEEAQLHETLLDNGMIYFPTTEEAYDSEELVVNSRRYFSALDFVHDIARQLDIWDRTTAGYHHPGFDTWHEWPIRNNLISLVFENSGRLVLQCKAEFMNNYMLVTSKLFQSVTGFDEIITYLFDTGNVVRRISSVQDIYGLDVPPTGDGSPVAWVPHIYLVARSIQPTEFTVAGNPPVVYSAPKENLWSNNKSLFDGLDVRKLISVEVSLPIPHTLAWNGIQESTRFVLQEFQIPHGMINSKYIINPRNSSLSSIQLREEQRVGPLVLLNGGSNMALKKMFEGQLQAFRIDLVLHYDDWNATANAFIRKRKTIKMSEADFFYLKLLFTKETL